MSADDPSSASLDTVIAHWAAEARCRSRAADLFRAAEAISGGLDSAEGISPLLAPHCTLVLRCATRGLSVAMADAVAGALAAQNAFARGQWAVAEVSSWPMGAQRGIGVRTAYAAGAGGEDVALAFHDILSFDACGRAVRVERTLLLGSATAADEVLAAMNLRGNQRAPPRRAK